MVIALGLARVDACDLDRAVGADRVAALERAVELGELAFDGGDTQVLDLKLDARVDGVDLPRSRGNAELLLGDDGLGGCGGGGHRVPFAVVGRSDASRGSGPAAARAQDE